jgi:hypothetical protein
MKNILLGAFYGLQGLINIILAVFFIRVDVSYGGSGGAAAGLTILFQSFLMVVSGFCFLTVLALSLKSKGGAAALGILSSFLLMMFYILLAVLALPIVLIAETLNAISIYFLYKGSQNKSARICSA